MEDIDTGYVAPPKVMAPSIKGKGGYWTSRMTGWQAMRQLSDSMPSAVVLLFKNMGLVKAKVSLAPSC